MDQKKKEKKNKSTFPHVFVFSYLILRQGTVKIDRAKMFHVIHVPHKTETII